MQRENDEVNEASVALWKQVEEILLREYPDIFPSNPAAIHPLKRQIHYELFELLQERIPGFSNNAVRKFLKRYCNSPAYRASHYPGAFRIGLDGRLGDTVTEAEYYAKSEAYRTARARVLEREERKAKAKARAKAKAELMAKIEAKIKARIKAELKAKEEARIKAESKSVAAVKKETGAAVKETAKEVSQGGIYSDFGHSQRGKNKKAGHQKTMWCPACKRKTDHTEEF